MSNGAKTKPVQEEKSETLPKTEKKRTYISQSDVPKYSLEEALRVPQAIYDNFAGKDTAPLQVAMALEISPSSSVWRDLTGAAIAYGLTEGGYNAKTIGITDLGKRVVAPTVDGDEIIAKVNAVLMPKILNQFYTKYNNAKFPKDNIALNVLVVEMDVPQDKSQQVLDLIKENGNFVGIIHETKSGPYIFMDAVKDLTTSKAEENEKENSGKVILKETIPDNDEVPEELVRKLNLSKPNKALDSQAVAARNMKPKVFITHGKNRKVVEQLKDILSFGQFEPVVSVERETTAIPVPEKVFNDMRECQAGVIHVENEQKLLDEEGNIHFKINENVLIEIGAAIAIYGKKFILLCKKGTNLPSNLQGLYRCDYDGEQLDYESTMKLLKAFSEFR